MPNARHRAVLRAAGPMQQGVLMPARARARAGAGGRVAAGGRPVGRGQDVAAARHRGPLVRGLRHHPQARPPPPPVPPNRARPAPARRLPGRTLRSLGGCSRALAARALVDAAKLIAGHTGANGVPTPSPWVPMRAAFHDAPR